MRLKMTQSLRLNILRINHAKHWENWRQKWIVRLTRHCDRNKRTVAYVPLLSKLSVESWLKAILKCFWNLDPKKSPMHKELKEQWEDRVMGVKEMTFGVKYIWNNSYVNCGGRWKWRMIIAVVFQFKQLERRSLA